MAIKESGIAHLELVLTSSVYLEQTALVTGIAEQSVRDEIKKLTIQPNSQKFLELRDIFIKYLLKTDAARLEIRPAPPSIPYRRPGGRSGGGRG